MESDLRSLLLQIASQTAPAARGKAIGGSIDRTPLVPLTASQGSPGAPRQQPKPLSPTSRFWTPPSGISLSAQKMLSESWVPALSRVVRGDDESSVATLSRSGFKRSPAGLADGKVKIHLGGNIAKVVVISDKPVNLVVR